MNSILRTRCVFVLCFWLSLAGSAVSGIPSASQQEHPKAGETASRAQADNEGAKQSPLFREINSMPDRRQEERDGYAADSREKTHTDRWMVGLTAFVAIFTGLLAVATAFLWKATRDLVREAKDSSEKGLRAYLNIFECYAEWESEKGLMLRLILVTVQFRNSGQTPARKVRCWANVTSAPVGLDKFEGPSGDPRESKGVVAPRQRGHITIRQQFTSSTEDEVDVWKRGAKTLFVYGKLIYIDAFQVEQTTHFRFMLPPEGVDRGRGHFIATAEGNDIT
jgi:hypothetical protein